MGWSYGATNVLELVIGESAGYAAAVAIYPSCWQYLQRHPDTESMASSVPLLILHGTADDWTLVKYCRKLVERARATGESITLVEYPAALHDFDNPAQELATLQDVRIEAEKASGSVTVGYDRAAHMSALRDSRQFFVRWLGGD